MTVNKSDLIDHVALHNAITIKKAKAIVDSMFDFIMEQNENGEKVKIMNFGSFEPKVRAAHKGVNPQTHEDIMIPETVTPKFKPGKEYLDRLQN